MNTAQRADDLLQVARPQARIYRCTDCTWSGCDPSTTDLSSQFSTNHDLAGHLNHSHQDICPICGTPVRVVAKEVVRS